MANYFHEEVVRPMVIEYLSLPAETRQTTEPGKSLRENIMIEVAKIVDGEIFTHRFTMWEEFDELKQDALMACLKSLEKFNPFYVSKVTGEYSSCFNYFSLTAKRCLKYMTLRNRQNRENVSTSKNLYYESDDRYRDNCQLAIDSILSKFEQIEFPEKYSQMKELFRVYLYFGKFYNKREFLRFSRCFNQSPSVSRRFLVAIEKHKDHFYDGVEEDKARQNVLMCPDFEEE